MKFKSERDKVIVGSNIIFNDSNKYATTLYKNKINNKSLIRLLDIKRVLDYKNTEFTDSDLIDFVGFKNLYYIEKYDKFSYFIEIDRIDILKDYMGITDENIELFKKKVEIIRDIASNKDKTGIDLKKNYYKYVKNDLKVLNQYGEELLSYKKYMKMNGFRYKRLEDSLSYYDEDFRKEMLNQGYSDEEIQKMLNGKYSDWSNK